MPIDTLWLGLSDIHNMSIYFVIGMLFSYFQISEKKKSRIVRIVFIVTAVIVASLLMKGQCYVGQVVCSICSIVWIIACWELAFLVRKNKSATWLSKHNFTIYIYSWLFQSGLMMICDYLGVVWYLETIGMFIIGLVGPIFIIVIYDRIPKIHCKVFDLIIGVK